MIQGGFKGMSLTSQQLVKAREVLRNRLFYLEDWRARHEEATSGVVDRLFRSAADYAGGAGKYLGTYHEAIDEAGFRLGDAREALDSGDAKSAERFLSSAGRYIDRAWSSWGQYLRKGADGACTGGTASAIGAGVLAGLATGGVSLLLEAEVAMALGVGAGVGTNGAAFGPAIFGMDCLDESQITVEIPPRPVLVERRIREDTRPPLWLKKPENPSAQNNKPTAPFCKPSQRSPRVSARVTSSPCTTPNSVMNRAEIRETLTQRSVGPGKATPLPTMMDLLVEAQTALIAWKQNPRVRHDMGRFILSANAVTSNPAMPPRHFGAVMSKWERLAQGYRKGADPVGGTLVQSNGPPWQESIRAVVDRASEDLPLSPYARATGRMIDVVDGRPGNCRAKAEALTSAVMSAPIALPPDSVEGIQMSEDPHVQYVVYRRGQRDGVGTHWVWDPLTEKEDDQVRATINDPHIFYHAFIEEFGASYGITSPVTEEQLVIAKPTAVSPNLLARGYQTNESFPLHGESSGFLFDGGPVPEFGYTPPPRLIQGRNQGQPYPSNLGPLEGGLMIGDPTPFFLNVQIQPFEAMSGAWQADNEREMEGREFRIYEEHPDSDLKNPFFVPGRLVFRTSAQARHFAQLPDDESQKDFLVGLVGISLSGALKGEAYETLVTLLDKPWKVDRYSEDQIISATKLVRLVKGLISQAHDILEVQFWSSTSRRGDDEAEQMLNQYYDELEAFFSAMSNRYPLFADLQSRLGAYFGRMSKRKGGAALVLVLNDLSHEKRLAYLELHLRMSSNYLAPVSVQRGFKEYEDLLERVLVDRTLFGVGNPPGRLPKKAHRISPEPPPPDGGKPFDTREMISVRLPLERIKPGEDPDPGANGIKTARKEVVESPTAPYRLSYEAMIDFTFAFVNPLQHRRPWTPEMLKQLERLNSDGRYDLSILDDYASLDPSSSNPALRTVPLPQGFKDLLLSFSQSRNPETVSIDFSENGYPTMVSPRVAKIIDGVLSRRERLERLLASPLPEDIGYLLYSSHMFPARLYRNSSEPFAVSEEIRTALNNSIP